MLAKGKRFLLLIRHPLCYSYIQSSPVKVLAIIKEKKYLHKNKRPIVIWDIEYFVTYCDIRYDFRIETMFGSSLPPVVWRRVHVLFTLFVFVLRLMLSNTLCCVFVCFSLSCILYILYIAIFSGLSFFRISYHIGQYKNIRTLLNKITNKLSHRTVQKIRTLLNKITNKLSRNFI
jgi:hypothetical protein